MGILHFILYKDGERMRRSCGWDHRKGEISVDRREEEYVTEPNYLAFKKAVVMLI